MMRRPRGAVFAADAYVFPGGGVHAEDEALGDPLRAAAVRELFEEVGILLARRIDGRLARDSACRLVRAAVAAGKSFPAALADNDLSPAFDRLTLLCRWITPQQVTRRFDTRFFVARRPYGQTVHPQRGEVEDWRWITPAAALSDPDLPLVHVTRRILESVEAETDVASLVRRLRRRRTETPALQPEIQQLPDGRIRIVDPVPISTYRQRSRQPS